MRRILGVFVLLAVLAALIVAAGCGHQSHGAIDQTADSSEDGGSVATSRQAASAERAVAQTGFTEAVPAEYTRPSFQPGEVERIEYESRDYAGSGEGIAKAAYVYTPYGYDEADEQTRYDVVYLMHGWTGHAGEYFEYGQVKNIIDHMIESGDIPPAIFVSPTFYAPGASNDFGSSVAALHAFHQEFENDLMPAVEGRFRTYAASGSDEDLRASRLHRVFGGFSLGSVTTWQIFCHDYDYVAGFIPMSGSSWYYGGFGDFQTERNVDFIEQPVADNDLDGRGYFVYHAVGTNDSVREQTIMQADEMLSRPDAFPPEHFAFYQKQGGQHDYDALQEFLYNGLPVVFDALSAQGGENATAAASARDGSRPSAAQAAFTRETPIDGVAADPAFGEWGRLLFPVQRGYMGGSTLGDLTLTWYNCIDPDMTVEVCNYLKDWAASGETAFVDIYTDDEKAADPTKADTGLVFFRGDPGARTAIVSAGGGFSYVGAMHDSFPHCLELSKRGYNAFALIYRPGAQTACEDLARAVAYLHGHADELGVSMDGYSLWGGSAGGRMSAWLGAYGTEAFGEAACPRPAACIVNYTGLSEVTGAEPPTYSAVGTADGIADWRTMQSRIEGIRANGTDAEIEVFDGLPHGFGLGAGTAAEGWIDNAVAFWERQL